MRNFIFLFLLIPNLNLTAQTITLPTPNINITPILHSSMVMEYDGEYIFMDPYGGAERYENFPAPDVVIITHVHGDHLNPETLKGLELKETELIAPQSVVDELDGVEFQKVYVLKNGENINWNAVNVEAIPMYNLPETDDSRHPKGKGNGYVLTIGGQRIYISGDTEDIPEMRNLKNIDYAFVCMNLPYTMTIEQAASAVLEFKPKVCFPFHFRGKGGVFSDVQKFKELVSAENENIDVRILNWYPEN